MKKGRIIIQLTGMIPVMLLFISVYMMSCSGGEKKDAAHRPLGYLGKHYGSRFETLTARLQSLPEDQRDTVVREFIAMNPVTPVIESDSIVSIYWYGKAATVILNGDVQLGWTVPDTLDAIACGGFTFFHRTFSLPGDARVDYLLTIDTLTITDPRNPAMSPSGYGLHSEIAMPRFQPDPLRSYRQDIEHGFLDSIWLLSRDKKVASRMAKVYIPAGYDTLEALPVLYVMDGMEALEFMQYPNVLDNLLADGKIEPLVVVFVPPTGQHSEYIGGGQVAFMKVLCDVFVPMIDSVYKTSLLPAKRGIAGISSGGHVTLLTVLSRPDVFMRGAGQSPTISDEVYAALDRLTEKGQHHPDLYIWIDAATYDLVGGTIDNQTFLGAAEDLHHELEKRGVKHVFHVYHDGHQWANWRERTDEVLVYLFGKKDRNHAG